jgi:hypothetical protein
MTAQFSTIKLVSMAEIIAATERAEDLLALWRECRRLGHRVRIARLKFDLIGLDPEEQDLLADEVRHWSLLVRALAQSRQEAV